VCGVIITSECSQMANIVAFLPDDIKNGKREMTVTFRTRIEATLDTTEIDLD
jgi:hypothetical protein